MFRLVEYCMAVSATVLLLAACGGEIADITVEKNHKNYGVPTEGDSTEKPSENVPSNEWGSLADSCTTVLLDNFFNKNEGFFWSTPQNEFGNSSGIYWQQAHSLNVVLYAFERIRESDRPRSATYLSYIKAWYDCNAHNYNASHKSDGKYGGFFNQYTDDMCWICLTLMRMSEVLADDQYAETAKAVYDNYIITRKLDVGDGIFALPWTDMPDKQGKNACTNTPACCLAAKLYTRYKDQKYLSDAKVLYKYVSTKLMNSAGRVEDPPLTYTQGTFGEACMELYNITRDSEYLDAAGLVFGFAFTSERCNTNTDAGFVLRSEGKSMDQSIFKSVLIPYAVNYVLDSKVSASQSLTVKKALIRNAEALRANLDRKSWPQMYCNYFWGAPYVKPVPVAGEMTSYPSMGAQASGASMIEGIARLEKAGKL